MLKEQIQPVIGVSNLLGNLGVYNYKYKKQDFPQVGIDGGFHYGLLAQEVEQHFPLLVSSNTAGALYDSTGQEMAPSVDYKSIIMLEFVPLLIQGFNEQKSTLDDLQQQINDLTQQLNNCCAQPLINDGDTQNNKASLILSNKETIILNQNAPNPFKDKTEIGYNIPESVGDAVILFYDQSGKVLQKFEINHRGAGSLTVYGEDLSSGAYTYSLIIDGENHQTKRMVKQ